MRWLIRCGFALKILLIALISTFAYQNTVRLAQTQAAISRSYRLRERIRAVQAAQMRSHASLREYLRLPKTSEEFDRETATLRVAASLLQKQAARNGTAQQNEANNAAGFVQGEADEMQNVAARFAQTRTLTPRDTLQFLTAGASQNKAATATLETMDTREAQILQQAQARALRLSNQTLWVTSAGGALALATVLLAFFVIEKDLTRRSRTEADLMRVIQELSESEARFKSVADTAPVMLYATDAEGAATFLSRPWLEFRGRTEAEELGFGWTSGIPERDKADLIEQVQDSCARRVPARVEYRTRRHDGAVRWLLASSAPRYINGNYVGHIGSAVDITDIKQAEEEMRMLIARQQKSETRLRHVSRQANCLLWEADVNEVYADLGSLENRPWTPLWFDPDAKTVLDWALGILDEAEAHQWLPVDWKAGETFNAAFDRARHTDDRIGMDTLANEALWRNKDGYRNEYRCHLADGSQRWIAEDVRIERIESEGLQQWHLVGVCTDITDRKLQEQKLTRITTELQRSNEALQDFASIASHDLREPLRKIQMFGGMLQKSGAVSGDATSERNLERVLAAAARMDALVGDLLAYSRVTSKAAPPALVNLDKVVGEVVVDLEARILETGGVVGVDGLGELRADALQMRQLFQNLIANALKFHKKDQPPLVLVQGKRELINGVLCAVIMVSDNGIGFEPEYTERVFNIFERLDRGREGYSGTGVGLAICRKIVQRHGGSITACSLPDFGTSFTVRLPLSPETK